MIAGSVDMSTADGSMNSAIKYLDSQFSALDFNNSDSYDNSAGSTDQSGVAALSTKYSQSASTASHAELPSINSFQATQQTKQNLPPSNISSVLNPSSKVSNFRRRPFLRQGHFCVPGRFAFTSVPCKKKVPVAIGAKFSSQSNNPHP